MKVVLFHIQVRKDVNKPKYERTSERMFELVSAIPGFHGIEGFAGEDGSELAVAWFDSDEAIAERKQHPEHLVAQERGRTEFFSSYDITIAEVSRRYGWPHAEEGRPAEQSQAAGQPS